MPLDGAGDGDEDADGEGEVAGALQHLVHGPGVQHLGKVGVLTEICTIFRKGAFYRLLQ